MDAGQPAGLRRGPLLTAFLLFTVALGCWSLATPLWASVDEFQHAFRAYATAHGQLYVRPERVLAGTGGVVHVPRAWVQNWPSLHCYLYRPWQSADCLPPPSDNQTIARTGSTAARYNPVYYFIVGLPSLVVSPERSLYAMRLVSAALSAFFLGWALTSALAARRPRVAAAAVLLATTPMVLFLGSVINPNGWEISAALSLWSALFVLLTSPQLSEWARSVLLRRSALSACAMVVTRALSPLWLAVVVGAALVIVSRRQLQWILGRPGRWWVATVVVVTIASVAWTMVARTLVLNQFRYPAQVPLIDRLRYSWGGLDRQGPFWRDSVGNFGWLDTPLPTFVAVLWAVPVATFVAVALIRAAPRRRAALGLLLVAMTVLPVLVEAANWNTSGPVWQARYTLPLTVGMVIVAGIFVAHLETRPFRAAGSLAVLAVAVAVFTNLFGFVRALERYVTGLRHPFSLTGPWQPPGGGIVLVVLESGAWLAGAALLLRATGDPRPAGHGRLPEDPVSVGEEVRDGVEDDRRHLGQQVVDAQR